MTDAPPPDPFSQPPQVAVPPAAAAVPAAAKKTPWALIIGAVAVVVAVIVGVVVFTGGDDEGTSGSASPSGSPAGGDWHLVRYVGDEVDAFEVLDASGAVVSSVPFEGEGGPALARQTGRWVVSEGGDASVQVFDLKEGTSSSVPLAGDGLVADRGLLAAETGFVAYASGAGGPLALIDLAAASGSTIGSNDKGYYPSGARPGYSLFMAVDFTSSIVIPHDDPSAWWEVPGPVSAISGRETIVLGLVDDEPAVRHFDGDQQVGKTVAMKAPQYAALFTSTGATTVDTGGGIWSIDFSTGEHDPLGTLGIGVDGAVPISADLMMTWNSAGTRVIAADGTVTREIEPTEDANALRSMRGNRWMDEKTSDSHYYRTTLIQSIATKLGEGGFIVFHCDGDTSWKKRKESTKRKKFDKLMEPGIRARLRDTAKLAPKNIEAAMKRVLIMVPYYSIESWLYQNTDEAIRICHAQYAGADVAQFEEWETNRKQLDETSKPKDTVCLKDKHNHALATTNFPFDVVVSVGKSLKQAVAQFEECTDLQTALTSVMTA